jgi:hypothetical protein
MTESESKYPHWKTALMGNGHVANLWCAIKYFIWHGAHLLLAVLGVALFVLVKGYRGIKRVLGYVTPDSTPSVPTPDLNLREKLTSETASDAGIVVLVLLLVGWFGYLGYALLMYALANPILFLAWVGGITLAVVALAIGAIIAIKLELGKRTKQTAKVTGVKTVETASVVKEKSKETRGLRRLLGYCPVSMSLEPKWFDSFTERLFGDDEAV